jgi:ankyrin repeat protein
LFSALIEKGAAADVNAKNNLGETPVFGLYVDRGEDDEMESGEWWDVLRLEFPLLSDEVGEIGEADIDEAGFTKTIDGWTEIPYRLVEDAGADLFVTNGKGQGLLHVAATGPAKNFKRLMGKGLDPLLEDCERRTALDVAAACGNKEVLKLFERGDGV